MNQRAMWKNPIHRLVDSPDFSPRSHACAVMLFAFVLSMASVTQSAWTNEGIIEAGIEDFLLDKLSQHGILVVPECLSHDSYDAIQLPVRLIKRWLEDDHGIRKLIVGLETETDNKKFELIRSNKYYQYERFATICPPAWGMFSTKELSEYLFFQEVMEKVPGRFSIFGFENSYHYYNRDNGVYLLPSQIDTVGQIEKVPNLDSKAPFVIKYIYSKFFRDYLSFSTIKEMIESNPDASFLIIIGNGHTIKDFYINETDEQIIEAYDIDTSRYAHTVGYFLKQYYSPLFIQSATDTAITIPALYPYDPQGPDSLRYQFFFADYYYSIPRTEETNREELPLLCIPSGRNFSLLEKKNFQLYPDEEHIAIAKKMIYFMTGVIPEIEVDKPGQAGACTFNDPETKEPIDFRTYREAMMEWYLDGTFVRRLREDIAAYNHRSLYRAIFRMMGKRNFEILSDAEGAEFIHYLLAALSVMGTEDEQSAARKQLSQVLGESQGYYDYYKRYYYQGYR